MCELQLIGGLMVSPYIAASAHMCVCCIHGPTLNLVQRPFCLAPYYNRICHYTEIATVCYVFSYHVFNTGCGNYLIDLSTLCNAGVAAPDPLAEANGPLALGLDTRRCASFISCASDLNSSLNCLHARHAIILPHNTKGD